MNSAPPPRGLRIFPRSTQFCGASFVRVSHETHDSVAFPICPSVELLRAAQRETVEIGASVELFDPLRIAGSRGDLEFRQIGTNEGCVESEVHRAKHDLWRLKGFADDVEHLPNGTLRLLVSAFRPEQRGQALATQPPLPRVSKNRQDRQGASLERNG